MNNIAQQAEIDSSRDLKDRVSDAVFADENASSLEERIQLLTETGQSVMEQEITRRRRSNGKKGRHKLADDKLKKSTESEVVLAVCLNYPSPVLSIRALESAIMEHR